jgi:hypothetical protein
MSKLIKDYEKTAAALEGVAFFRNFAKATFNRHVEAVYWKEIEAHQDARKALLITDKDTQISIANKQLLFFFSLQKFTQQTEETQYLTAGSVPSDPEMIYLKVQLSPSLLYFPGGQPVGKRYIQVPHVDEAKLGSLKGFKFKHGSITRLYVFPDKKQIKVQAFDEIEGNKAINSLLGLVLDKWKVGTAEDHAYTGKPPRDKSGNRLTGITSTCNELHIHYPHQKAITFFT